LQSAEVSRPQLRQPGDFADGVEDVALPIVHPASLDLHPCWTAAEIRLKIGSPDSDAMANPARLKLPASHLAPDSEFATPQFVRDVRNA